MRRTLSTKHARRRKEKRKEKKNERLKKTSQSSWTTVSWLGLPKSSNHTFPINRRQYCTTCCRDLWDMHARRGYVRRLCILFLYFRRVYLYLGIVLYISAAYAHGYALICIYMLRRGSNYHRRYQMTSTRNQTGLPDDPTTPQLTLQSTPPPTDLWA